MSILNDLGKDCPELLAREDAVCVIAKKLRSGLQIESLMEPLADTEGSKVKQMQLSVLGDYASEVATLLLQVRRCAAILPYKGSDKTAELNRAKEIISLLEDYLSGLKDLISFRSIIAADWLAS